MLLLILLIVAQSFHTIIVLIALVSFPGTVAATSTTVDTLQQQQQQLTIHQCGNTTTYCPTSQSCCAARYSPTKFGCTAVGSEATRFATEATGISRSSHAHADVLVVADEEDNRRYLRSSSSSSSSDTESTTTTCCCKPGPPNPPSQELPNCLILGDSVSIGYTPVVADILNQTSACQVQHGPWDVTDGGAGSTAEALPCLDNYLVTQHQTPVQWDVILFNFGLHNLNDTTPEAQAIYRQQLAHITRRLLQSSGQHNDSSNSNNNSSNSNNNSSNSNSNRKRPKLIYATTTPFMPAATQGNHIVDELNEIALQVMEHIQQTDGDPTTTSSSSSISILDLNKLVHSHCGTVYESCDWCNTDPCSYHYNDKGKTAQGIMAAAAIRRALSAQK